jgi:hypothetical protein
MCEVITLISLKCFESKGIESVKLGQDFQRLWLPLEQWLEDRRSREIFSWMSASSCSLNSRSPVLSRNKSDTHCMLPLTVILYGYLN